MGKKKRSSQNSNNAICHEDSSESESSKDSLQATEVSKVICNHLNKSSEISTIRKNIKVNKDPYSTCCSCKKSEPCKDGWVCLRCASYNCGPNEADHRTEHYKTPRSDEHSLAFQISTNTIWCFKCEQEIPIDVNKKVQGCVDLIKKQNNDNLLIKPKFYADPKKMNSNDINSYLKTDTCQPLKNSLQNKENKPDLNLPRVRGLMNLGNTCFFNSVLQCLAQTPGLVPLLEEMEGHDEKFHLELDGVVIDATLEKHKSSEVSEQLARILTEVAGARIQGEGDEVISCYNPVNPRSLLRALTNKCPQFEGGDQHDSHELLRHLLDTVYKEDLKRYQVRVLEHIGYFEKARQCKIKNLEELDDEMKTLGKKLNQKVCDTILIRPEHLFKGSLVSILQCTVCGHVSKRDETFLDLSLPVAQEKAQPPSARRKHNSNIEQLYSSSIEEKETPGEAPSPMSKCQQRKAKRKMSKNFGGNKITMHNKDENQAEATIEEEDKKDSVDGDQTDADVEDNEDIACEEREPKMEIVESGYSSEKQMSARGSPVTTQSAENQNCDFDKPMSEMSVFSGIPSLPGDPGALLATRAESGLGSIQELTVTIPEDCNPDCTSQESVQVNASGGSPDISSDSQQGNFRNIDLSSEYQLPHCNDCSSFRREMVLDWNCSIAMNEPQSHSRDSSSASLSVSPGCSSRDNLDVSPKGSPVSGSHSNNMSICTTLPNSNDNMSICDSLPENVSLILNSPVKSKEEKCDNSEERIDINQVQQEKEKNICNPDELLALNSHNSQKEENSGTEEIIDLKLEHKLNSFNRVGIEPLDRDLPTADNNVSEEHISMRCEKETKECRQISRSSPVEMGELTELDSGLLKLSLEGMTCAGDSERRSSPVPLVYNDQEETGFVLVGTTTDKQIPLPPPSPPTALFTAPYKFTHPEPAVPRYEGMYPKYKIEEGECSLQSCLSQFTKSEMLTGNNKVGCEACTEEINKGNKEGKTVYQNSSKQLLICKLPPIVIFHLKRFQVQSCSFRKISRHVDFPLVLDISPYCSLNESERTVGPILYSLYGVVEHSGTLHGGHYVAYVKVRSLDNIRPGVSPPGKWYYISDSRVSNIDENEVLTKQAYLLFYERIL